MIRFRHLVALVFALTVTAAAAAQPDPSSVTEYGYYCTYNYKWNGTRAKIYHPTTPQGCSTAIYSPLVVLFHGYGFAYTDYNDLLRHLARNGFIAVSIDVIGENSSSHDAAVAKAKAFMKDFLWTTWSKRFYIDPSNVGIIGHSRGGGTAANLALALSDPDPTDPPWQVKAVVELAPVSHGIDVDGTMTIGHMLLHGTHDGDQTPINSFRHYDNTGSDDSQLDPVWDPTVAYKSMKTIENAGHAGFSMQGGTAQQALTKGYVLSFLRAHLHDDVTWYEDYVRGDEVPNGWEFGAVASQYSDGFLRRVIDHFEDGTVGSSTIGGSVLKSSVNASVLDLWDTSYSAHDTQALDMLATNSSAYVRWNIPPGKRNANAFRYLSFRIGQTSGSPTTDLRVQIRNGFKWSPELRVTDYGAIPQRFEMCTSGSPQGCLNLQDMAHMGTVRVPLSAFGPHDNVTKVRLRFRGNSIIRHFHLDNLEFSEWIFKP